MQKDVSLLLEKKKSLWALSGFFFAENFFRFIRIHLFSLIIGGFLDCCQIRSGSFVTTFFGDCYFRCICVKILSLERISVLLQSVHVCRLWLPSSLIGLEVHSRLAAPSVHLLCEVCLGFVARLLYKLS